MLFESAAKFSEESLKSQINKWKWLLTVLDLDAEISSDFCDWLIIEHHCGFLVVLVGCFCF